MAAIYTQEIGKIAALPTGAEETAPTGFSRQDCHTMPGKEIHQDVPRHQSVHARTAAAMGNTKGLMQIQMAKHPPEIARRHRPSWALRLAHPLNLTAVGVDDLANLLDRFLENTVG